MKKSLLLVDLENVHKVDLSLLDDSFRAIIYVGANQNPPKAASKKATAHKFQRVDFQKIEGTGKNALDFHIAFELGRTFATAADTECIVLSKDKGFDPLLIHLNKNGLKCRRVSSLDELAPMAPAAPVELVVCKRCLKSSTIDHHGGKWCTNCGCFASPPDLKLLPSRQAGFEDRSRSRDDWDGGIIARCGQCNQRADMTGGIYDDGEWMCGHCIGRYAT
ncbi:PIN domain-containing protein [Variovorax ginsengisoli]|uniref:PIN domain-containing protein n=1 Tax=Variovorax ginsengisoli TaxID=363844 RepID=A0ABT8SC08_9BURK|nr:PIN domain-containing protein [Variovorax ginsengisoli]MDN8617276.1 PIN domain-containing protein [Variovorax ginsengisoli]MDO1536446.1 PIN domain-containing protein [Variovorax ginsengisoli]